MRISVMRISVMRVTAIRRISAIRHLLFVVPVASVLAQTPPLQMGVVYECQPAPLGFKFLSCTGTSPNDLCEVQSLNAGRPMQRGKSTYAQVMGVLPKCHLQTPAEAKAEASGAAAPAPVGTQNGTGPGGFKAGDRVRILADGWQDAQVLQVRGNAYFVQLANGVQVSKIWPSEVRRIGALTAQDHAAGQYDLHDRVQVLVNGRWMEGEVRGQTLNMYHIRVPGVDTGFGSDIVDTTPENIRVSTTPAPAAPAQRAAGQPPKPGFASCAGKYEGRWESTSGMAGNQFIFRSGKVSVTEGVQKLGEFDCYMSTGKIYLYKAGSFMPFNEPLEINNDGTLQTELGAIKKMGN